MGICWQQFVSLSKQLCWSFLGLSEVYDGKPAHDLTLQRLGKERWRPPQGSLEDVGKSALEEMDLDGLLSKCGFGGNCAVCKGGKEASDQRAWHRSVPFFFLRGPKSEIDQ